MKFFALCVWFVCAIASAQSVLVYDMLANRAVAQQHADQQRSIASITKVMTAMIVLDYDKDLSRQLMLSTRVPSSLPVQQYTREQLLTAMLVRSDNAAAETLAADFPGGRPAFVHQMNSNAHILGMRRTKFADPSGLSIFNISTVYDVVVILQAAASYRVIQQAAHTKNIAIEIQNKKKTQTVHLMHTSGDLLTKFDRVLISKTGYTQAAGWCVAMLVEQRNSRYIIVVLGSHSKKERSHLVNQVLQRL